MRRYVLTLMTLVSVVTLALAQDFSTSSQIMNTGSNYSSTVFEVGVDNIDPIATTTTTPVQSAIRRSPGGMADPGEQSDQSPIGGALLPLVLMAAGYAVAKRRQK